jgi:osmotically-inducible protein OsmY
MKRILFAVALSVVVAFSASGPASAAKDTAKDAATSPDNTKVNKEMRENQEMTADQQSENEADRKITQQVRKAVVKNKALSTYARNVKIITHDGMVTLKGPVRSEKEKRAVEKAAAKVAGKGKVTNELEVKPKE